MAKVAHFARRDTQRSWSRKTANLIEIALRNLAPLDWRVVQKFADLPAHKSDVEPLLPRLESWARAKNSDPNRIDTVGSLALQHDLMESLSPGFSRVWLNHLKNTNPFRAVEIWKKIGSKDLIEGILIYLAANQVKPALELAKQLEIVSREVIRAFIARFVEQNNFEMAQNWINKWQSPLPEDIRWLHHFLNERNVAEKLNVPSLPESSYLLGPCIKIGQGMQRLVSSANKIIVLEPHLLDTTAKQCWIDAMTQPSPERLHSLVLLLAKYAEGPFTDELIQLWITILRLCPSDIALNVLQHISQWLSPRAFAVVLSRADAQQVSDILAMIPPDFLYTAECLSALAQTSPSYFLEIIVPPELLETTLKEHHLLSLWSANPPEEIKSWLVPVTRKYLDSARLLHAALRCLLGQADANTAQTLLKDYVNRNFEINPQLLSKTNAKLPKPKRVNYTNQERHDAVEAAMKKLFNLKL